MSLFGSVCIADHIMWCEIEFFYLFIRNAYTVIFNADDTVVIIHGN